MRAKCPRCGVAHVQVLVSLALGDSSLLPVYSPANALPFVAWPEFAGHIRPGFSPEPDTGGRGTATGMESGLRDSARSRMPR